jgi:hypothetical protein
MCAERERFLPEGVPFGCVKNWEGARPRLV